MNPPTDRDVALGSGSTPFERDCAIARHCSRLGYLVTLADVQKWNAADAAAVLAWVDSGLIADRPAFLDRFSYMNQEEPMAPKKDPKPKKPKEKKPKGSAPKLDAQAAKQLPDTKVEKFKSRLRVLLPKDAVAERADRMAHVIGERENLVAQAKAATAHLKAQIKEKDAEIGALSAQIRDKAEYAEVECERRYHYRTGKICEVRLDTDETTFERAMTFSERQLQLPTKPAQAKKPKDEQLKELGDKVKAAVEDGSTQKAADGDDEEAPDQPGSDDPPESSEEPDEEAPESGETGGDDAEEQSAE
jgi:hypothetical protein